VLAVPSELEALANTLEVANRPIGEPRGSPVMH